MVWQEDNKDAPKIVNAFAKSGAQIPASLRDKLMGCPDLPPGMELYVEAWEALNTERSVGFGMGPIPWSACRAWCRDRGLSGDLSDMVWRVIRRVDGEMLKRWHESSGKDAQQPPTNRGKGQGPR